jgi:integrative and conjugative element protein (TIGR02256 family)
VAGNLVLVTYTVIAKFEDELGVCKGRAERGGILIGCYRGPHIEVTGFTTPGPKDIRHAYRFTKQDPRHQRAADRAWRSSGGRDTHVGEWHTHPLGEPNPSFIDKTTWREVAGDARRTMIFAIVAPEGWRLFRCQRRFMWTAVRRLTLLERGASGLVFGVG